MGVSETDMEEARKERLLITTKMTKNYYKKRPQDKTHNKTRY